MIHHTKQCRECDGEGELECGCDCPHCDAVDECGNCMGTGFNPEKFDLPKYTEAVKAMTSAECVYGSWNLMRGRFCVGRQTDFGKVCIDDFKRKG